MPADLVCPRTHTATPHTQELRGQRCGVQLQKIMRIKTVIFFEVAIADKMGRDFKKPSRLPYTQLGSALPEPFLGGTVCLLLKLQRKDVEFPP